MSVGKSEGVGGKVEQLSVTVLKDEKGYGMTVSGNDPVIVQSVVINGAAWRAGVRYGDRLLRVNGTPVERSMHHDVVEMIKSSNTAVLVLQRSVCTSKVTAPLPVDREKQRQMEYTKIKTLKMMLEDESRHIESIKSLLAHTPSEKNLQELETAELRREKLKQQISALSQSSFIVKDTQLLFNQESPVTPPRPNLLPNVPRSLTNLTNQSLHAKKPSQNSQSPVTCLDGAPPPLPPRTPNIPPVGLAPKPLNNFSPGHQPQTPLSPRHMEPNSIGAQMNYPLAVTHPPVQGGVIGHQRSRSSPEQMVHLNSSNDIKDWEMVVTPPGTPPPPYLSSPSICQVAIDPQKEIISMEEDEPPMLIIRSQYAFEGFTNVASLSAARMAVFLNWLAGERRPPQAALLYLLSKAYSSGPAASLPRWAYELHSVFLVPGAPLALSNVDENMAREIDDVLINEIDKEDILRKIFTKVREKAEEELNQQLSEFQVKRQSGLGSFYGPADSVLRECEYDKVQEIHVIRHWLMPRLNTWITESLGEAWDATHGSHPSAILAAAIYPLLQHTFNFKSHVINSILGTPPPGVRPRPSFLQRDKIYKQRVKHIKSTSHPLRGHHFSPVMVTSVSHCNHCHLLIWGIAPQAYNCSDCKFLIHRSCAKLIEETCPGPPVQATRISRIMEKLAPGPVLTPTGNSHQHIESNQHLHHHHHHHDKKQRKSLATPHFLNIERSFRKNEEENHTPFDHNTHHHFTDIEIEIVNQSVDGHYEQKVEDGDEKKNNDVEKEVAASVTLTDSECDNGLVNKKKKNKPKHRKTMSMSNTIEMVKSVGDEWFEAAKREIGEHSKKKENAKKKKESTTPTVCETTTANGDKNENVVLLLSDATVAETDDFEVGVVNIPPAKPSKKKEVKVKDVVPKTGAVQMTSAQRMGVRMIAKASSVGALNFMRKKRPAPIIDNSVDHVVLSTELFLDSERFHSDMVQPHKSRSKTKKLTKEFSFEAKSEDAAKSGSDDEIDGEIFYDAKDEADHVVVVDEENRSAVSSTNDVKPKTAKDAKVIGSRTRKTFSGSLKRTAAGGRRRPRRRSAVEDIPPLPPRGSMPPPPAKTSHWLFGSSFKGDGKVVSDENADGTQIVPETWDKSFDHSTDKADNANSVRQRPVTRAESYRDNVAKVQRTKRKTSDPNQLTSNNTSFADAETSGNAGAPSGGSSNSSLSSRSNDSGGQYDQDSHSGLSEDEESAEPWSAKAPIDLLDTLSPKARKRQDLIHELITTEASHVRWLRILRRVFFLEMQKSKLLPATELRALFPNLPDVLQRHRKLSSDLKTLAAVSPVVKTKPLAEALINTFGEPKYPVALAKFCAGQRFALDALRERQRRNKEFHTFMVKCEQDPLCARRRLQDFLACVWQRLTKYQLLLENIVKTGKDDDEKDPDGSDEDGFVKISRALDLAKEILHTVDTAIKTNENEQHLKMIQAKLEIRGVSSTSGTESDPGELKKLDLAKHSLVMEGNLIVRQDSTKRITVHALMLKECLILLHKESDKYILRPIPQAAHQPLSPVIHWNTVFFRPNAAVKNAFFLVNIHGNQMYDMAARNSSEYNTWNRCLSEAAKALGVKSTTVDEGPPPPLPANPPPVMPVSSEDIQIVTSEPNTSVEEEKRDEQKQPANENKETETSETMVTNDENDVKKDLKNNNKFGEEPLMTPSSVDIIVPPEALTAYTQLTPEERLRQAEEKVVLALREAAEAAKEVADTPPSVYSAMETLLGKSLNDNQQWKTSIGNGLNYNHVDVDGEKISNKQLLLAAQSHVNNLTEVLFRALRVSPADCSMTRCSVHTNYGLCDTCFAKHSKYLASSKKSNIINNNGDIENENPSTDQQNNVPDDNFYEHSTGPIMEKSESFVMLEEVGESSTDPCEVSETDLNLTATSSIGLRKILATLLERLPTVEQEREVLRARLQQADQRIHRLHHMHKECANSDDGVQTDVHEVSDPIPNVETGEG